MLFHIGEERLGFLASVIAPVIRFIIVVENGVVAAGAGDLPAQGGELQQIGTRRRVPGLCQRGEEGPVILIAQVGVGFGLLTGPGPVTARQRRGVFRGERVPISGHQRAFLVHKVELLIGDRLVQVVIQQFLQFLQVAVGGRIGVGKGVGAEHAVDGILVGLARTGKEEGEGQIIRLIRRRIPVVMDRADRVFGVKGEIIDIKRHTGGRNRGDGGGGVQQRLKILTVREKILDMLCVIRERVEIHRERPGISGGQRSAFRQKRGFRRLDCPQPREQSAGQYQGGQASKSKHKNNPFPFLYYN